MPESKRNETLETHIGNVGTEAKINQEELVKSRRKIWSIPIAALALVLMLVGGLVATGVAQAQATGTKSITTGTALGSALVATEFVRIAADLDDEAAVISMITIPTGNAVDEVNTMDVNEFRNGLDELDTAAGTKAEAIVGFELDGPDKDLFVLDLGGTTTQAALEVAAGAGVTIQNPASKGVFNVTVKIFVDNDLAVDSAADTDTTPTNDRDEVNELAVTIYALKQDGADITFATTPILASQGDRIVSTEGAEKSVSLLGMPARAKVASVAANTSSGGECGGGGDTNFDANGDGNSAYITYGGDAPTISDDPYELCIRFMVDTDGDLTDTDVDLQVDATVNIEIYGELKFMGLADSSTTAKPVIFSVRDNAADGTQVGTIGIAGAREGEFIDIQVRPTGLPFDLSTRGTGRR